MPLKNPGPLSRGAGTVLSAAFAGYLQSHPNWATENPNVAKWLYILALISAVYLFVTFILQWNWGRWFLGVCRSESVDTPNKTTLEIPKRKLTIHSAEWGAGDSFRPVEKILQERATDVLFAHVDLDLFHGDDPATGKLKQLRVTYSFEDEKERTGKRTVIRNQHEMLVIPEDMFLKRQIELLSQKLNKQITVTGLRSDDPRLEVRFVNDERGGYLEVVNRGKAEIQWIRVFPLILSARTLIFDHIEPRLAPNERTTFSPNVGDQWGTPSNRNFIRALSEHWVKTSPSTAVREATSNCKIDYEDSDGTHFELLFELVYRTIEKKEVECRNFTYRRIPKGITPQEN